jgi:hypothetical protein
LIQKKEEEKENENEENKEIIQKEIKKEEDDIFYKIKIEANTYISEIFNIIKD